MSIISGELEQKGIIIPEDRAAVVKRVIHTTADFDYAENLCFTDDACRKAQKIMAGGCTIITDTNMAGSGVSKAAMKKLGCSAVCYMADPQTAADAKKENTTRAVMSMRRAAAEYPSGIYAVGNAPTALLELCRLMDEGLRPSLIVAVPVGFVNVVEAKKAVFEKCRELGIPCIAAMGRKGGSTVAAAICNALLYSAADFLDPAKRGWN